MQAGTQVDPERSQLIDDLERAADAARRAVEGRKEAVPDRLYLMSAEPLEALSDDSVVPLEHAAPTAVAELCCLPGGINDVGEEHGCQYAIGSRTGRVPVTNSSISSITAALSPIHGQWSPPCNSTYLAPGMCSAR